MKIADYCSYELSKLLKAAGFDEPCDHFYEHRLDPSKARISASGVYGEWGTIDAFKHNFNEINDNRHKQSLIPYCSAPTLWQAQKWLREKKGIAINVIAHDGGKYSHEHVYLPNYDESTTQWGIWHINHTPLFDTYEEALSAGIAEILRLLVGKESEQS